MPSSSAVTSGLCFIKHKGLYVGLLAYVKTSLKFYETEASYMCMTYNNGASPNATEPSFRMHLFVCYSVNLAIYRYIGLWFIGRLVK